MIVWWLYECIFGEDEDEEKDQYDESLMEEWRGTITIW
tara:strand:- start:98 stop:211 length:114 start_codon:yes stop_codon:yes gene_type:complete